MGIGVGGGKLQCGVISLNGFSHAAGFVEYVAKVKICQGIPRINFNCSPVMLLCQRVFLPVVVKRAQVDVSGGVIGIKLQHALVGLNRKGMLAGIFLQSDPTGKQFSNISGRGFGFYNRDLRAAYYTLLGGKVEHELAGNGLNQLALMAESDPMMARRKCSRFEQRILHASYLFLHGLERLTNHRRTHFARAQIAYFLNLQPIKKGIALGGGYQSGLFPSCQLTRREPQNANQIRSIVSIHSSKELCRYYRKS